MSEVLLGRPVTWGLSNRWPGVSIDWRPHFSTADLTVADIVNAKTLGGDVQDQFDVTLEDSDLLGEVELTTNLIIAASESDEALSTAQIDAILGVGPAVDDL